MNLILPLLAMAAAVAEPELKAPETSRLFEKFTDPESGVVSYLLKPGLEAYEQQSLYFTQKSMTDDGRFLVFDCYDGTNETADAKARAKMRYAAVDFRTDRIIPLTAAGDGRHQIPFLDVKNDALYYVNRTNETFCRRDLKVDPLREIEMCPMPKEILAIGRVRGWFTHLTMNPARTKAFLETRITVKGSEDPKTHKGKTRCVQGVLDVTDGSWHPWSETPKGGHALLHPFDENLAYYGASGFLAEYAKRRQVAQKKGEPFTEKFLSMCLAKSDGTVWQFGPEEIQHATHQIWSEDGTYLYWCSRNTRLGKYGVYALDLATRAQRCVAPVRAMHATVSPDNRFIAFDWPHEPLGRGSGWETAFHNIATKRQVFIHSSRPPIADIPHKRYSNIHPDPHPQFVMNGRYVVSSFNTESPRRLTVSVTPVAQLVEKTGGAATP